jgi:UPF0755 protein
LALGLVALALLAGVLGSAAAWRRALAPVGEGQPRYFEVKPAESPAALARRLVADGLIRSAWAFRLRHRLRRSSERAGCYQVAPSMSVDDLLALFASGNVAWRVVTFPEGYTVRQCAEKAAAAGFGSAEAYADAASGRLGPLGLLGLPAGATLEGYLFPDTYRLAPTTDCAELARAQARRFAEVWRELTAAGEPTAHTRHEYVTIASLIERETSRDDERPLIAGVIENRLRRGMKLQIDASVLYALGYHKRRLVYSDLQVDSPYNTYRAKGLPPGPIANPGRPSLAAALAPASHDYLFYVLGADGRHVFSRTEAEHNQAKKAAKAGQTSPAPEPPPAPEAAP